MMLRNGWAIAACAGLLMLASYARQGVAAEQKPITMQSLLADMTDLANMAEFPSPAYTTKQFSSYDRASKTPANHDAWFANGDCGQYLRVEENQGRKEYVMADMQGPGAIVRIWSANPAGTVRIYIDGNATPAIEAKMADLLGGRLAAFPKPLSVELSKGWNLYLPIPYAKSCKVTGEGVAENNNRVYYHVNYRTYTAGADVTSFTMAQLEQIQPQIKAVAQQLASPRDGATAKAAKAEKFDVTMGPANQTSSPTPPVGVPFNATGPKAVASLVLKVKAADLDAALRGTIMSITFDGEKTVEAPIGDFFGSAPGINAYASLPLGMTKDGEMYCHWFMPFRQSCQIKFRNTTNRGVTVTGEVALVDYKWTDSSMYFHAKWRAEFDKPTRPMVDWNYLTAQGKGVFGGVAFSIDNPVRDWWGEGDEKIYFDGQTFPSHFGTGTEDYYGYAWCWPGLFTHAYHNQSRCDGPGNYGRTSVNRWHILDRIPFTKDFKFDMELWHWKECKVNIAVTAYWYAMPGATDAFKPIDPADAVVRPLPTYAVPTVKGAIEGEKMRVIESTATADPQDWDGCSGGRQLWWHSTPKPGDTLVVGFNAPKAGKYHVFGRFLKAVDYGIVQLAVNGQKAGQPIDFFNNGVQPMKEMDLGVFELKEGENRFSATIVGANEKAVKGYMFGLDYLRLVAE